MTMNVLDALRLMVRHYGPEEMARKLGKPETTLEKELGGSPTNKMGAVDADYISTLCIEKGSEHCHAYANLVAGRSGRLVELPMLAHGDGQPDVSTEAAKMVKEAGDVLMASTKAMANRDISENEHKRLKREISELIAQAQALSQAVDAQREATLQRRGI